MTNKKPIANSEYDVGSSSSDSYPGKNILNRFDHDLFDEEKDVVERVVRVKRVKMSNKGECWKIIENGKLSFLVEGAKISKKEKEYLRTPDGFNFLITQFKFGIKSINKLKFELKNKLK